MHVNMGGVVDVKRQIFFLCRWALLLIFSAVFTSHLWAQSTSSKSASSKSASSGHSSSSSSSGSSSGSSTNSSSSSGASSSVASQSQDGPASLGFSIESEMLTYRALESNSEAVACDIAAYLNGGSANFTDLPAGSICTVKGGANTRAGVIIFPFDQSQFAEFRMWRADMQIMSELRTRAQTFCPAPAQSKFTSRGLASSAADLTPIGPALSAAQGILGLMASETSTTAVAGTIQDQALMDGVARELRSLSVPVLMPATYAPDSLTPINVSRSPFLTGLQKLFQTRKCLVDLGDKGDATSQKLISDIDSYVTAVTGNASSETSQQSPEGAAATPVSSPSHLMAVLSADSLAQKLGVDPATGLMPDTGGMRHVLMLKALESGGAISKKSNIFGSKMRYSGGSVATYALFSMDGELECSGNVYEYGGSIPAEAFEEGLREYVPDPSKQFIFQRGSCVPTH